MDLSGFSSLIDTLIAYATHMGQQVNDMPGGLAFALGLVTWFAVEQILRRILSWIRWLVLAGVITGLGFSVSYVAKEFFSKASTPVLEGQTLSPEDLFPAQNSPEGGE